MHFTQHISFLELYYPQLIFWQKISILIKFKITFHQEHSSRKWDDYLYRPSRIRYKGVYIPSHRVQILNSTHSSKFSSNALECHHWDQYLPMLVGDGRPSIWSPFGYLDLLSALVNTSHSSIYCNVTRGDSTWATDFITPHVCPGRICFRTLDNIQSQTFWVK